MGCSVVQTMDTRTDLPAEPDRRRRWGLHQKEIWAFEPLSGPKRAKRVWECLADYASADLTADVRGFESLHAAGRLLRMLVPIAEDHFRFIFCGSEDLGFRAEASRYQGEFRKLLLYLCKPESHPELRTRANRFLIDNARGVHRDHYLQYDWIEGSEFDERMGKIPRIYFSEDLKYESVIAVVCKFIFDRINPRPREGLPIRMCKRAACGKYFVPKRRSGRLYCCGSCKSRDHQSNEEKRDQQYVWRLEQVDDPDELKSKLGDPDTQSRLTAIECQWPKWAVERIKKIKDRLKRRQPRQAGKTLRGRTTT